MPARGYEFYLRVVNCSRVKIWSFHGKAHLVFHLCLYNNNRYNKIHDFGKEEAKRGPEVAEISQKSQK